MANTIRLKRSSLAGKVPATTDLALGEIAINTTDGKLYLKKSDGGEFIVEVGPVTSVAGRTGAVTLARADVGLGNVDNTSDAAKPVSTATQTALNAKASTTHSHAIADVTNLQPSLDGKAPTSHTHTAAQISDSTAAGRSLLGAADAAGQRTSLGLGALATLGSIGSAQIDAGAVTTTRLGGDITTAGKALLDDADAAAQRVTLGLGTGALRNVTVGTTAPASPAVNDLWVDTN